MFHRHFKWFAVVGLAVLVCAAPAARAVPVPLNTLTSGGSITCGDKLFNEFGYIHTGDMPASSLVNVVCNTVAGNLGLRFQGAFIDAPGGGGSDALITYTVTVTDPRYVITDAHLEGNPVVIGAGIMSVTETFTPDAPDTMYIYSGHPPVNMDSTIFATGYTTLHAKKDILGYAFGDTSYAILSYVDQTYSQTTTVPEPSTLGLLGIGLLGLGGYGWRRRR